MANSINVLLLEYWPVWLWVMLVLISHLVPIMQTSMPIGQTTFYFNLAYVFFQHNNALDDTEDVALNFDDDAQLEKKSKFRLVGLATWTFHWKLQNCDISSNNI